MTSITTAIEVGSFSGSEVAPISDLGIFASLGVMVSLFLTLTLLPALLSITKLKAKPKIKAGKLDSLMKTLAYIPITFMMMLILGSVRIGLLTMIPNLTPIILGLLIMYIDNIPLDMFTLLIGSIAIGLAAPALMIVASKRGWVK